MYEDEGDSIALVGEVTRRSNEAYQDGWGFGRVRDVTTGKEHKIVGNLAGITLAMTVRVEGTWVRHERYGMQIKLTHIWEDDPRNEQGMLEWMDKRLPNIGPKRGRAILNRFGVDKMFEVIEKEPELLLKIDGITEERVEEIKLAYQKYKKEQEVFTGLYRLGFNKTETNRIMQVYKKDPLESLKANPFDLYRTVKGFTFKRLDEIRDQVGLPEDLPERLCAAIIDRAIRTSVERGHTVREFEDFMYDVSDWVEQDEELMMEHLGDLVREGRMAFYERGVMLRNMDDDEGTIASKIKEMLRAGRDRRRLEAALGGDGGSGSKPGSSRGVASRADGSDDDQRDVVDAQRREGGGAEGGGGGAEAAVEGAGPEDRAAKAGAAPRLEPDAEAFDLEYWGAQGRGVFGGGGSDHT